MVGVLGWCFIFSLRSWKAKHRWWWRSEASRSSVLWAWRLFFSLLVAWAGLFDPLVCVERENARITGKCGFCGWSLHVVALSVCRPTGEYAWPSGFRATSSSFFVWILSRLAFLQACGQLSRLAEGERGRSAGNGICWAGEKRRGSCSYRCVVTTGRRPMTEEEGSCSALMACFPRSRGSQTSRRRR